MVTLLEYHVGGAHDVAMEVADIRRGLGYQDRATDLVRAATLWERHEDELRSDTRRYEPGDGARARKLAQEIVAQLQQSASASSVSWADLRLRAFSRMARLYEDLRQAAAFVFRNEPAQLALFPPLRSAALAHFGRRTVPKTSADPAPPPAQPTPPPV